MADNSFLDRKTVYLILMGVTVIGIALRLYHLNYQSLWYDELHSIIPADPQNSFSSIIEYCKGDQPPAFFLYLHLFFKLFGYSEVSGRLASAIIGIVAIPVMFLLGKEIKDEQVGLFAAFLTSLNYMHIYYSQEVRFYSMAFLFAALSFLFLIRSLRRAEMFDFVLYVLFTAALLYTHYYGLVVYVTQVAIFFLLLGYRSDKVFVMRAICSGVLVFILFIPWTPVIFSDLKITSFWIRRPEPTFLADYFYYYFGKDFIVTIIFVILATFFLGQVLRGELERDKRTVHLILLIWLLLSYLIPYIKSIVGPPMLHVRYTIITLPVWFLIFSLGWSRIRSIRWQYGIVSLLGLSMLLNLFLVRRHYFRIDKQQFREASQLIKSKNISGIPVYSEYQWHFNFYFDDHLTEVRGLNSANLANTDAFWLLYAEFFSNEEKNQMLSPLLNEFEIVESYTFHKTEAFLLRRVVK